LAVKSTAKVVVLNQHVACTFAQCKTTPNPTDIPPSHFFVR
jgi:hypothetical protein